MKGKYKKQINIGSGVWVDVNFKFPFVHMYDATPEELHHNQHVQIMYKALKSAQKREAGWISEINAAVAMMDVDQDKYDNLI